MFRFIRRLVVTVVVLTVLVVVLCVALVSNSNKPGNPPYQLPPRAAVPDRSSPAPVAVVGSPGPVTPARPEPVVVNPPAVVAPTVVPVPAVPVPAVSGVSLAVRIGDSRAKMARDAAAVSELEKGCLDRLAGGGAYLAASDERDAAAAAVRDDLTADANRRLVVATQSLWEIRKQALAANLPIIAARRMVDADENDLVELLAQQGVPVVAVAAADSGSAEVASAVQPGHSRTQRAIASGSAGTTYVHSYTRKDGTYVSGYTRRR